MDYFLYLPLLPEVAAAVIDPRRITVSLPATLPGVRLVLGEVHSVSLDERTVPYTDPEGGSHNLGYDRLILAAGSVNKLLPIPGVGEHAHGFRNVAEALYLRDHIIRQIELADATDDPDERTARCTFVVVGAGYTGTEVAAQGPLFTDAIVERHPHLRHQKVRWLLLDLAPKVLPELDPRLSRAADRVLRRAGCRGGDGRLGPGGDPRGRAPHHRRVRPDADPRLVRRGPPRPTGRGDRPAHPEGPARGGPDAGGARSPRGLRLWGRAPRFPT